MPRPWKLLESITTAEGQMDLRRRGDSDFAILIDGRMLMNSYMHRTENAVAEMGCAPIAGRDAPRVLIGGLGLGFTLRAVLEALPPSASVVVAELEPVVVEWCQGPVASLTDDAMADPRVEVVVGDVMVEVRDAASGPDNQRFDAVILDLYLGPDEAVHGLTDPIFGAPALASMKAALTPGGVLAIWGEEPNRRFVRRMRDSGFQASLTHTLPPGPRHAVYIGRPKESQRRSTD